MGIFKTMIRSECAQLNFLILLNSFNFRLVDKVKKIQLIVLFSLILLFSSSSFWSYIYFIYLLLVFLYMFSDPIRPVKPILHYLILSSSKLLFYKMRKLQCGESFCSRLECCRKCRLCVMTSTADSV